LDSSAVLALLLRAKGAEVVLDDLAAGSISSVNAAEVLRVLARSGLAPADARRAFARLQLAVIPFDYDQALEAATVAQRAPHLSLGDCACLALARHLHAAEVLTADKAWAKIDCGARVKLLR
jgi:PIN domain nuclease of toxin-antitoxin system